MAKSKIKVKVVEITNNLLPSKPKLYKPALQTPTVVSSEKFIENIAKETGLSRFQAANVLSCIFQTAGDYMELGNAVQMHEDFGTLKPYIKVKAVADRDKVTADCILGMGLRLIPTGKMRTILGGAQYTITGMSTGGDVEDSEVVDPNDPSGNGGGGNTNNQQQGGGTNTGGGTQNGGGGVPATPTETPTDPTKVLLLFNDGAHNNVIVKRMEVEPGYQLQSSDLPSGYTYAFKSDDQADIDAANAGEAVWVTLSPR